MRKRDKVVAAFTLAMMILGPLMMVLPIMLVYLPPVVRGAMLLVGAYGVAHVLTDLSKKIHQIEKGHK